MKKLLLLAGITMLVSFYSAIEPLSKKERKFAASQLKTTKNELLASVKDLSDAQLNFKSAPDKWSVKDCIYHLALSENALRQWVDGTMKAPANPEKRADIKMTDEQVIAGVTDRSKKVKTSENLEPQSSKWASAEEALNALKEERSKLIEYVKKTKDDLRNHVATETPLGAMDAYQLVLLISSHTSRHMQQINEVKADPNFPKN